MTTLPTNMGAGRNSLLDLLLRQKLAIPVGTPTNPTVAGSSTERKAPSMTERMSEIMGNPMFQIGMNMLANSGPSTVPKSFGQILGESGLQTMRMQQQAGLNDLQRRLFESQIGLNRAKANSPEGQPEAKTTIGKLFTDHRNGFITERQLQSELASIDVGTRSNAQNATSDLRGEFRKDTDGIRSSMSDLAKAKALVSQGNPIAATAAFTSFIRSIDNSVVRPAEQAAYSSAGGLARRLQDEISKLQGDGPLGPETQQDLLNSIEALEAQLDGIMGRTVDFYNNEASLFKLRPESVTGIPSMESPDVQLGTPQQPPEPVPDGVTPEEWMHLTPEERALWN